jgi:hypothetical protein
MRKTVKVEDVKQTINDNLRNTSDELIEWRKGQISLIESILMDTGAYYGFSYLSANDMASSNAGTTVGVREFNETTKKWNFENTDDSRIYFC